MNKINNNNMNNNINTNKFVRNRKNRSYARRNNMNGFRVRNPQNAKGVRRRMFQRRRGGPVRFNTFRNYRSGSTNNNNANMSNYFRSSRVWAPQGLGYNVENNQKTTIVLSRTGFIHALVGSSLYAIHSFNMHPTLLPWVKTLSGMYNKYMFSKLAVRYIGQCPSTFGGYAFVAFDYDVHAGLAGNLWRAQAYDKFVMCPVWSTSSWISVTPNVLTDKWYESEVGSEHGVDSWHDKYPGRIILGTQGANTNSDKVAVGQIEISYTLHLTRPNFVGAEDPPDSSESFTATRIVDIPMEFSDDLSATRIIELPREFPITENDIEII